MTLVKWAKWANSPLTGRVNPRQCKLLDCFMSSLNEAREVPKGHGPPAPAPSPVTVRKTVSQKLTINWWVSLGRRPLGRLHSRWVKVDFHVEESTVITLTVSPSLAKLKETLES